MTQILPYLKSIKSRADVEEYLHSLVGQGKKQASFIQRFSEQRFRANPTVVKNQNQRKLDSAFPSLQPTHRTSSSTSLPTTSTTLGNFPIKNRQAKQTSQTNTSEPGAHQLNPRPAIDPKIFTNFGNSANVYMKSRDSEDSVTKLSKKKNARSNPSGTATPEPSRPTSCTNNPDQCISMEEPNSQKNLKLDIPPDIDIPISQLSRSSLQELLQLKLILEGFESENSTLLRGKPQCFCESRDHGLPIGRLPKQCAHCGLIYCRLKPPLTSCPSCDQPTPLTSNHDLREKIRAEFLAKRNELIKLEIEKYQKRVSLELKKAQAIQEADRAYPSLPTTSTSSKTHIHHQQQQASHTAYSNQLHPGPSIQNRIQQGYGRLAQEHSGSKKQSVHQHSIFSPSSQRHPNSSSHTVLRLNSSNGKTKIIKTTNKNQKEKPQAQEQLTFNHVLDPQFSGDHLDSDNPAYIDPFDDLCLLKIGRSPLPFVDQKLCSCHTIPDYVPVAVYQV